MNKANLYLFTIMLLIVVFLFSAHYLRYQQDIVLEKDGYQIVRIDKSQTISPHKEPIVFVIESESDEKEIYKFNGYENGDFGTYNYQYLKPDTINTDNNYYFIEGFKNNLPFQKELKNLSFEERYDIVNSGKKFEARQLIQHNLEPGVFGYIDTMPLIFIVLGFVFFLILKIIGSIEYVLTKVFKDNRVKMSFQILLIIFIIFFLTMLRLTPWYPASQSTVLMRNIFVIVPIFVFYQWTKQRYKASSAYWKIQLIYFLIIFIGGNILLWIGNSIGYLLDAKEMEKIILLPFFCTYNSLAIGFLMAFSIATLLNNSVNEIISKRKQRDETLPTI